jgi:microcystin-dependent protein
MSDPYIGEIRMFGGNFPPSGWATCDGQLIPISENDTLFNLIGTTYGGDGQNTFALPNLAGRLPLHAGQGGGLSNYSFGQNGGVTSVTLNTNQIPNHQHNLKASTATGDKNSPLGAYVASPTNVKYYVSTNPVAVMNAAAVQASGGAQPHDNMMPFLAVTFIISLFGIYPSPT